MEPMEVTIDGVRYAPVSKAEEALATDLAALTVMKAQPEKRFTLGLAYPAMRKDTAVALDGHIDFVGEDALEKTAWKWIADNREIGLFHKDGTEGHAMPVESYIYRGPDWVVKSPVDDREYTIKSGDWLMGSVWDEVGWSLVKSGFVNGWSPEGKASRVIADQVRLAQLRG